MRVVSVVIDQSHWFRRPTVLLEAIPSLSGYGSDGAFFNIGRSKCLPPAHPSAEEAAQDLLYHRSFSYLR